MLVEAVKIAAGRLSFTPGQQFDLSTKEAEELIAAGAVFAVEKDKPPANKKTTTTKTKE